MANFFVDEIFACSCGNMLFEEKETKSYKIAGKRLIKNTNVKSLKCSTCGKETLINDDDEILEQA